MSKSHACLLMFCLIHVPYSTIAMSKKYRLQKRIGNMLLNDQAPDNLFFKGTGFSETTMAARHGSVVLECEAGGKPSPTIHWLRNGERILQGTTHSIRDDEAFYEDHDMPKKARALRLSSTRSRLFLDCLTEDDEAVYTCVAETPTIRKSRSTSLVIEKTDAVLYSELDECFGRRSSRGEPARVYMSSVSRLEYEGNKVQLFCRAQGIPSPTVTWYDRDNQPIENGRKYKILRNGDLIIRDVSWIQNMGLYTCEVDNGFGTDSSSAFLYPTSLDNDFPL